MRQAGILLAASPRAKIPSRAKPARELAASPQKVSRAHPLPPATQANFASHSAGSKDDRLRLIVIRET